MKEKGSTLTRPEEVDGSNNCTACCNTSSHWASHFVGDLLRSRTSWSGLTSNSRNSGTATSSLPSSCKNTRNEETFSRKNRHFWRWKRPTYLPRIEAQHHASGRREPSDIILWVSQSDWQGGRERMGWGTGEGRHQQYCSINAQSSSLKRILGDSASTKEPWNKEMLTRSWHHASWRGQAKPNSKPVTGRLLLVCRGDHE